MTKRPVKTKTKRRAIGYLPRPLLNRMLRDLSDRIHGHINDVEAVQATIQPNGQHVMDEHRVRTVFVMMLDVHLRSLRDIEGLANLLIRDEAEPMKRQAKAAK
jgi:hypothetical protein